MPNSLRAKLSKLRYKGEITQEEYTELIKKLDGHDDQIREDERRKSAEWFAEVEKVSEPIKEDTINRWLEDFAKWKKEQNNVNYNFDVGM